MWPRRPVRIRWRKGGWRIPSGRRHKRMALLNQSLQSREVAWLCRMDTTGSVGHIRAISLTEVEVHLQMFVLCFCSTNHCKQKQ